MTTAENQSPAAQDGSLDGTPVNNKSVMTRRFNELQKAGWTIVRRRKDN